jgi:hypothetical protein
VNTRPDHEELVRDVNDHIREILEGFSASNGEFICECDLIACTERVSLTLREYDTLREVRAVGSDGRRVLAAKHRGDGTG